MTVTFKLSPEVGAKLKNAAARKRVSTSKYLRDMVESKLRREKAKPFESIYDAIKDSVGCIDSGVTDRATNPKYMQGFGKWRK